MMQRSNVRAGRRAAWLAAASLLIGATSCEVGAAPPGEPVTIYLDGSQVLVLEPSDVTAPLDLLQRLGVEPGDVRYAELRAPGETPIRTNEPLERYPKRILAAFPTAGGVGVGWVDRVLGRLPTDLPGPPPVSFAPASEVRLRTLDVERASGATERTPLRIRIGEQQVEYEMADLNRMEHFGPQQAMGLPGGRQSQAGVPLSVVVENALKQVGKEPADVEAVVLTGPDGDLRMTGAELLSTTNQAAAIKRNRKGLWRLKTWTREGDEAVQGDGMRGVDEIVVEMR